MYINIDADMHAGHAREIQGGERAGGIREEILGTKGTDSGPVRR